jgi:hypothetical protein
MKFGPSIAVASALAIGSFALGAAAAPVDVSSGSAGFYNTPTDGAFSDTYTFTLVSTQTVNVMLSSVVGGPQNVDFSSVFLTGPQGAVFNASSFTSNPFESWKITDALLSPGQYSLTANGTNSVAAGSYAGSIALSGSSSAPVIGGGGPLDLSSGSTGLFGTPGAGNFSDAYTFSLSSARAVNVMLSSVVGGDQDVDFTSVSITGPSGVLSGYELTQDPYQNWVLSTPVLLPGSYTLTAAGSNSAARGTYAGSIALSENALTPSNSVPEPGTWALMLAGLAAASATARRPTAKVLSAIPALLPSATTSVGLRQLNLLS